MSNESDPPTLVDMDDETRERAVIACVAYMTRKTVPIKDTKEVAHLLEKNAGRFGTAMNVRLREYLTFLPADDFQSLETLKYWMGVRKALEYASIGRIGTQDATGLSGTFMEVGTFLRYAVKAILR